MTGKDLLEKMSLAEEKYIEEAEKGKKKSYLRYTALAACLCLIIAGGFFIRGRNRKDPWQVLQWQEGFQPSMYFIYCDGSAGSDDTACWAEPPYAYKRIFTDWRESLEADGIIPVIDDHPLFGIEGQYNEDGSLYALKIGWYRRSENSLDDYSDLVMELVPEDNTNYRQLDLELQESNYYTVTQRDGVSIFARGDEKRDKLLYFTKDGVCCYVRGSWNDSFDDVAALLDWLWGHPIDLSLFTAEAGDIVEAVTIKETPDAFIDKLPDFYALGYLYVETTVVLKNGEPISMEGHYAANVTQEQIDNLSFYEVPEAKMMHWCIDTEPDYYDKAACHYTLEELTEETVQEVFRSDNKIIFWQGNAVVTVYPDEDINDLWQLIKSLQNYTITRHPAG